MLIGDPGDEQSQPILRRLGNLDPDASSPVNGWSDPNNDRRYFYGSAVGPMSAQVKPFASIDLLIEVEECTGGGNVIRLGRFTPG